MLGVSEEARLNVASSISVIPVLAIQMLVVSVTDMVFTLEAALDYRSTIREPPVDPHQGLKC